MGQLSNIWKIELQFMLGNITLQMYVIKRLFYSQIDTNSMINLQIYLIY